MFGKIKEVFGSIRFWQLLVAAIVAILAEYGILSPDLVGIIVSFLGVSIAVRTIDKVVK